MNKKKICIVITLILILIILLAVIGYKRYKTTHVSNHYKLIDNLKTEYGSKVYPNDFIDSIKGKIINKKLINTYSLGKKEVKFYFINEYNKKVYSTFNIEIVDTTPPLIWVSGAYSVTVGYTGNLEKDIFCADNYDRNISCTITGDYDLKTIGKYNLNISATDTSNNNTSVDFVLYVNKKTDNNEKIIALEFSDVVKNYKTENTKIGIDVSKWQGNIDWKKVSSAGVEFAIIRIGGQDGVNGEHYFDSHFKDNIKGALENKIPIGLYYYSYATSVKEATKQVKWIVKNINDYDITLPIAFDWEIWNKFNSLDINLTDLNLIAESYLKEVKDNGYIPILYSSKNRLERIWNISGYPVWLAHYVKSTDYKGEYLLWQMSSTGHVDGIEDNYVDIDIIYLTS